LEPTIVKILQPNNKIAGIDYKGLCYLD